MLRMGAVNSNLFEPMSLGSLTLSNRIVMAPMSRHRARLDGVPTTDMLEYYRQRASAGLIITEGTSPSPMALGYLFSPGIFTQDQVDHWRPITDAVHASGSRIFCQLMHCGRLSDPLILPNGADPIAPSAVRASRDGLHPPNCPQLKRPFPRPKALTTREVSGVVEEYAAAANRALEAGFDGQQPDQPTHHAYGLGSLAVPLQDTILPTAIRSVGNFALRIFIVAAIPFILPATPRAHGW
jgi:N-ethylmaleimide reductase